MKHIVPILLMFLQSPIHAQYFSKVNNVITVKPGDSRSANWIDFNEDGWIDLLITNGPAGGANNYLYKNTGNGVFIFDSLNIVSNDGKPSDGASCADYNNDGLADIFVANYYNINNLLYKNIGGFTFNQESSSPATSFGYSETGSFGDYDKDGLVDLYVCNSGGNLRNFLYHNDGNSIFSRVLTGSMVTDAFYSRNVNWVDIDNDLDPDLFITNESNQNENIYENTNGSFIARTVNSLTNIGGSTMSSSWADIDNDGDLDVVLANDLGQNRLIRNDGNWIFTNVNDSISQVYSHSFSTAWSDVDNDADVDLFITNSFGDSLWFNYLYLNDGSGHFSRISTDASTLDTAWSYGCAFGDYDNDGFEDLVVATTRDLSTQDKPELLYHNNGNTNHWITLTLKGVSCNKMAIGARVKAYATINGVLTVQSREISAQSGYCSQNDIRVHFGLKDAQQCDSIIIYWPDNSEEHILNLANNQFYLIVQGQGVVNNIESVSSKSVSVYPNPTSDKLTVHFNTFWENGIVIISDVKGSVLSPTIQLVGNEVKLDLEKYAMISGIYFITMVKSNHRYTEKFIKN